MKEKDFTDHQRDKSLSGSLMSVATGGRQTAPLIRLEYSSDIILLILYPSNIEMSLA